MAEINENKVHKSLKDVYAGIMEATCDIQAGKLQESDRAGILKVIQKHDSRADESDVDDVINRIHKNGD